MLCRSAETASDRVLAIHKFPLTIPINGFLT
jgi:hypothetical protein